MNYFGIIMTVFSHMVAGIYMERPKYNKIITSGLWLLYAVFSISTVLLLDNVQYNFYGVLIAQFIIFFISAKGVAGEKIFLFLTYATTFCISIGVRLYVMAFFGEFKLLPFFEIATFAFMHILLYKFLLPIYQSAKIFFQSGWLKMNIVLTLFSLQFINQYAFNITDKQSAKDTIFDFVLFGTIFYFTLFFIFTAVKDAAEINKKIFENNELKNMAYSDELTKLKNRTAYMKYARKLVLEQRNQQRRNFISVVMDINGFKNINDIQGHTEGDRVLKEAGNLMSEYFGDFKCKIFRVGGDEFVLIAEDMSVSEITTQMESMNEKMLEKIGTTISFGWAEVKLGNAKPFDEAFKKADEMMYYNKQQRKVNV